MWVTREKVRQKIYSDGSANLRNPLAKPDLKPRRRNSSKPPPPGCTRFYMEENLQGLPENTMRQLGDRSNNMCGTVSKWKRLRH
eukprot:4273460-Amphidinium_carterae.1